MQQMQSFPSASELNSNGERHWYLGDDTTTELISTIITEWNEKVKVQASLMQCYFTIRSVNF